VNDLFQLTNIHFAFEPERAVLTGAEFRLGAGERVALTGPNGAGKTTLFHIMVGLLIPQRGSVVAFGHPRREEKDFRAVRARAGLLFQDSDDQLFCPTVREDVAFGPLNLGKSRGEAEAIARRTLEGLGLRGYFERITHRLSGGEKRQVALASILAMEPEVLLLDEPTNALDRDAEVRLLQILTGLPQAMVIISHREDFLARIATRKVRLEGGRLRDI